MVLRTACRVVVPLFFLMAAGGCAKKADTPSSLLEQAKSNISESKYTDAINVLQDLTAKYPKSPEAAEAQYMLGDTFISYSKDFERAVEEYRLVVRHFPESRFAVNAQFMLGYVYANFLNDVEKARREYGRFLELYSDRADSGLIQSVKFELENLGKDLKEIPQLRHITS